MRVEELSERYKQLRIIKQYSKKDYLDELFPASKIYEEIEKDLKFINDLKPNYKVVLSLKALFCEKNPKGKILLKDDHFTPFVKKLFQMSKVFEEDVVVYTSSSNKNQRVEVTKIFDRIKNLQKILKLIKIILFDEELNFSHQIIVDFKLVESYKKVFLISQKEWSYYSRKIEEFIPEELKKISLPKEKYKEAYSFSDIPLILKYYLNISPVILNQTENQEVSIRCLRANNFDLMKKIRKKRLNDSNFVEILKELDNYQVESFVRRKAREKGLIKLNDKKDISKTVLEYFGFEIIPCRFPKNIDQLER